MYTNNANRKRTLSSTTSGGSSSSSSDDEESSSSHPTPSKNSATDNDGSTTNNDDDSTTDALSKYSSFAQRMMASMGYKKGKGLGKHETGRVDIVETSNQRGRRGLGLKLSGLDGKRDAKWVDDDEVMIKQEPLWIPSNDNPAPLLDDMYQWTKMGERKEVINDEYDFCERKILDGVLASKSVFDHLGQKEFLHARTRSNPYETIRKAIFLNRAAMKMAEMDASFDYMFTKHADYDENNPNALLYFADICAGPGGFSEYVLWRKKWHSKGFGFTLRAEGANDFKLDDFKAGTPETFDCHYGVNGYAGDGDIFREDNLREFRKYVFENTNNEGLHFVMADGGFSVEGQENIQEILSKQLYLCQFLCALSVLREGGHFMCKLFDVFTPFSMGLAYLMYRAFDKVCIFKPVTSRPANSERYIVCHGMRKDSSAIHDYMFELNVKLNNLKGSDIDICEVVPVDIVKDDEPFFHYMYNSNNELGARQILGLKKLATYVQNTMLVGPDQGEVRKQCLEAWDVPTTVRSNQSKADPDNQFESIVNYAASKILSKQSQLLTDELLRNMKSVHDYKWAYSGGERVFLFSLGRHSVFQWNPSKHTAPDWKRVNNLTVDLPRHTVLDVEMVHELKGDGRGQRRVMALHIIDAVQLGEEYIADKPLSERLRIIQLFVNAVTKPCRTDIVSLRVKEYHSLVDIGDSLNSLEERYMKPRMERRLVSTFEDEKYFVPTGVYLIKRVKEPWHLQYSRSSKRIYFYNSKTNKSVFEPTKDSIADLKYCVQSRMHWLWSENGISGWDTLSCEVTKDTLVDIINDKK